jgi:hypothetical protein
MEMLLDDYFGSIDGWNKGAILYHRQKNLILAYNRNHPLIHL